MGDQPPSQPPPSGQAPPSQPPPSGQAPPSQPPPSGQAPPSQSPPGQPPYGQYPPRQPQAYPPPAAPYPPNQPYPGAGKPNRAVVAATEFFKVYLPRAFRLSVDPTAILPSEKAALEGATPPVTDPEVQAFLTWRRSLLFVIAVFLVPVTILRTVEFVSALEESEDTVAGLMSIQWLVELAFAIGVWILLRKWTNWPKQRRLLLILWLVFFLTPFLVWLFPLRSLVAGYGAQQAILVGIGASLAAIITLAPKALSLMPGLLRASTVSKTLFPGSPAPGWLMALAAPIYALLVYVILLMPYQLTGDPLFVLAMIGFIGAPIWLGRAGFNLAKPLARDQVFTMIGSARKGYLIMSTLGMLFLTAALGGLVSELDVGVVTVINVVLSLFVNVLLLSLVATDTLLTALERARRFTHEPGHGELMSDYDSRLGRFMAASEPAPAPPKSLHPEAQQPPVAQQPVPQQPGPQQPTE